MDFRITTSLTPEERDQWDRFVQQCPVSHSFQSYAWGVFQEALTGRDVFYLIGSTGGQWRAVAQIFRRTWPWPLHHLGNYEISCGPAFLNFADLQEMLRYLDQWAARRAVQFFIGPRCTMEYYKPLSKICSDLGFQPTADPAAAIYGEETLLVDLRPPEGEIYQAIRYTTRCEIRDAEKAGVTVRFARDPEALDIFYDIYRRQKVRKEVSPIDKRYFVLLQKHVLSDPKNGCIAIAELEGRPMSAAICTMFGKVASYRWGTSDEAFKKSMSGSHLLHWQMMRHFKAAGCDWYDFSGASPSLPTSYFSYGVNLFKTGFSKHFVKYTPDFVKSYHPVWSGLLQSRDSISGSWNVIKALRPFRLLAFMRNRLDAEMSPAPAPVRTSTILSWKAWPRALRMSLAVSLLFLMATGFVVSRHELWKDEMKPWVMARDSTSTVALLNQIRDEGASPLWPLCLRVLSHWNPGPQGMQLFNLFLGAALIFVFWFYAPFSPIQKLLLTFNYYLFYQYAVVSRHYLLGLLFLAIACVFYETRWSRPYRLGIVLFLACMTSRNAMILSLGIASAFLWEALQNQGQEKRSGLFAMGIFAVSIFLTGMSMRPVLGVPYFPEWYLHPSMNRFLWLADVYAKAFLAIPVPGRPFWAIASIERMLFSSRLIIPVAALLFFACASAIRLTRGALVFLTVSTLTLLLFFYAGYLGIYRHAGFLFFAFLFAWWLSRAENEWDKEPGFYGHSLFTGLLFLQMAGGMISAVMDVRYPYSGGKEAARYISTRGFQDAIITVGNVSLGIPLSGYLDRPIYYPEQKEWASYTPWAFRSEGKIPDAELLRRTEDEANLREMEILMILDHPLDAALQKSHRLQFLRAFTGALVGNENYYLYYRRFGKGNDSP